MCVLVSVREWKEMTQMQLSTRKFKQPSYTYSSKQVSKSAKKEARKRAQFITSIVQSTNCSVHIRQSLPQLCDL